MMEYWRPQDRSQVSLSYEGGQMCYELQGSARGMPSVGLSQDCTLGWLLSPQQGFAEGL